MVPYTSIPFSAALFLILVGVLIGHLIWYRNRGQSDADSESVPGPLRDSAMPVALPGEEMADLRQQHADREAELQSVKASYHSLEAQWHELRTGHDQLQAELTRARHDQQQASRALKQQIDQQAEFHKQISERDQSIASLSEQLDRQRTQTVVSQEELRKQRQAAAELRQQLEQTKAIHEKLTSDREAISNEARDAKQEAELLREQFEKQLDEFHGMAAKNAQLERQTEAHATEMMQAHIRMQDLQEAVDGRANQVRAYQERYEALQCIHNEHVERLTIASQQRSDSVTQAKELERQLRELRQQLTVESQAGLALQTELDTLRGELARERELSAQTAAEVPAKDSELAPLRQRIEELKQTNTERSELESMLQDTADRLKVVARQRDVALQTERSTKNIVSELRDELNDRLEALEALRKDKDETIVKLAREKQVRLDLDSQLKAIKSQNLTEMKSLVEKMRAADQRSVALEAERDELAAKLKEDRPRNFITLSSFKGLAAGAEGFDEANKIRFDESLGAVYDTPPTQPDDLKRISGIAEILEQKLNSFGIYKFQQIMQWDDVAVDAVSKQLSFRDRVQRENWIGQARRLYREQYGVRAA